MTPCHICQKSECTCFDPTAGPYFKYGWAIDFRKTETKPKLTAADIILLREMKVGL